MEHAHAYPLRAKTSTVGSILNRRQWAEFGSSLVLPQTMGRDLSRRQTIHRRPQTLARLKVELVLSIDEPEFTQCCSKQFLLFEQVVGKGIAGKV